MQPLLIRERYPFSLFPLLHAQIGDRPRFLAYSHLKFPNKEAPRRPRVTWANVPVHIIQRGNNRQACFFSDDDYHRYLEWLQLLQS